MLIHDFFLSIYNSCRPGLCLAVYGKRSRTKCLAIAEGPRDALCQLKSCQLVRKCTRKIPFEEASKRSDSYIALLTRWPNQRALQFQKWQLIILIRANGAAAQTVPIKLDPRYAASKDTTAPINHTRPSPRKHSPDAVTRARNQTSDYSLLLNLSTSKGWKAELA